MSIQTYSNNPRVTISWPSTTTFSTINISWYGNTAVKTGTIYYSGNLAAATSSQYTTADLSFNATYTFTLRTYNSAGVAGKSREYTVTTTPQISGSATGYSTTAAIQIQWGALDYSYARLYRQITSPYTSSVVEPSAGAIFTGAVATSYYDSDVSGATTYVYYIVPYDAGDTAYPKSSTLTFSTAAQSARSITTAYYDSSSIQLSFTAPRNSYTSSYYYNLQATYSSYPTLSASGQTSPLWVTELSGNTTYSLYIQSYLDGSMSAVTPVYTLKTAAQPLTAPITLSYDSSSIYMQFTTARNTYTSTYYYLVAATAPRTVATNVSGQTNIYWITGLSGNTIYTYNIYAYFDGALITTLSGDTITTPAQTIPASALTGAYYDSSGIRVSFSLRNSYESAATTYYVLTATDSISGVVTTVSGQSSPLTVADLSGNSQYDYYCTHYLDGSLIDTTATYSLTTAARWATDLSAIYVDVSAISISFTAPQRNYYAETYYYVARANLWGVDVVGVSGQTGPLWVTGLSGGQTYSCYIDTYLDGTYKSTSSVVYATTLAAFTGLVLSATRYS
jgi:hypothetical protein